MTSAPSVKRQYENKITFVLEFNRNTSCILLCLISLQLQFFWVRKNIVINIEIALARTSALVLENSTRWQGFARFYKYKSFSSELFFSARDMSSICDASIYHLYIESKLILKKKNISISVSCTSFAIHRDISTYCRVAHRYW